MRAAIAPDGQVTRVRPLRGGVSSSVHLVQFVDAAGERRAVVVRRYGEYWQRTDPAGAGREFTLLEVLARASFPAPRPLMVDAEGGPFGFAPLPRPRSNALNQPPQTIKRAGQS